MTKRASGRGRTRFTISRIDTPSHVLSSFDQRVTQWMSDVTVTRGRAWNSAQVQATSRSTSPKQRKVERAGSNRGVSPWVRTGHFSVRICPGGTRCASAGSIGFMGPLYAGASQKLSGAVGASRIIDSSGPGPARRTKGSGMNGERKLAMFMDFENIARGVKEAQYKQFELKLVLERLLEKGKIIVRRAYADWNRFTEYKRPFHEWAIELIDVPQSRYSGKNSADIRMVVDALDLAYGKTHIDTFALVSGDSDFSPLVSKLRENDRYVIGLGVKSSSSDLLVANCDEFIFYEDLIRDTKKTTLLRGLPEKKAEAMDQLIDAIQALQRENKETLWGSMVKQTMIRKNPAFNETYYGFSTFSKLLEDAAKQKIVSLERDEKSGTYVITALTEEGGRAA